MYLSSIRRRKDASEFMAKSSSTRILNQWTCNTSITFYLLYFSPQDNSNSMVSSENDEVLDRLHSSLCGSLSKVSDRDTINTLCKVMKCTTICLQIDRK